MVSNWNSNFTVGRIRAVDTIPYLWFESLFRFEMRTYNGASHLPVIINAGDCETHPLQLLVVNKFGLPKVALLARLSHHCILLCCIRCSYHRFYE